MTISADIFCKVIDNFGDLGVCWRLARQLHHEHGISVTLWVDDMATFARMDAGIDATLATQMRGGIRVCLWRDEIEYPEPGNLVIEGFGCPLPLNFLQAMTALPQVPVWLNLEYLSAEDWVEGCHGLTSPHPQTGLSQHFWFPGFTSQTGGLLREQMLLSTREEFQSDTGLQQAFWTRIGVPDALQAGCRFSLFAYENSAISGLLDTLADLNETSLVVVPKGRALADVERWAGRKGLQPGDRVVQGALTVAVLPFLSHDDYDRLLWACDINAVRGEDSFVRAQWAARPLLWHIYPQDEDAHWAKLEAFLAEMGGVVPVPAVWSEAMRAWNRGAASDELWRDLLANMPALTAAAGSWSRHLAIQPDLATSVMRFYASQVEYRPLNPYIGTGNA